METKSIFDSLADLGKSFSKVMPMEAIWLNKPVQTGNTRTVRIKEGDTLRIEDSSIVDVSEDAPATHKVVGCFGNISNSILYFELEDLKTQEFLKLNIK